MLNFAVKFEKIHAFKSERDREKSDTWSLKTKGGVLKIKKSGFSLNKFMETNIVPRSVTAGRTSNVGVHSGILGAPKRGVPRYVCLYEFVW